MTPAQSPIVLKRLQLENVHCFEHLDLRFASQRKTQGQWTVLLGDNGVGKSTRLKAIAIASFKGGSQLLSYPQGQMLRHGADKGRVFLDLAHHEKPTQVTLSRATPLQQRLQLAWPELDRLLLRQ